MNKRFIAYPLAFLVSIILLLVPSYLTSPQRNLRAAIKAASLNPKESHQTFASYFKAFPNVKTYILVLYTGNQASFSPIQYVTIAKVDQTLTIDLIKGAGIENVSQLSGDKATKFLKDHQIKLDVFDSLLTSTNE